MITLSSLAPITVISETPVFSTMTKRCNKCSTTKPAEDFFRSRGKRDGLASECKECSRARHRAWVAENRERDAELKREWYARHNPGAYGHKKVRDYEYRMRFVKRWMRFVAFWRWRHRHVDSLELVVPSGAVEVRRVSDLCAHASMDVLRSALRERELRIVYPTDPRQLRRARGRKKDARRRDENRAALNEYKAERGCAECGESDPTCLDFHHRDPGEKSFSISKKIKHSMAKIMDEVAKCDILCANCHRRHHAA